MSHRPIIVQEMQEHLSAEKQLWSEEAWQAAVPEYKRILSLPFISELSSGELPEDKFIYYLEQDSLYLQEYSRVMALLSSRFDDPDTSRLFMSLAMENLDSEKALHNFWLSASGQCGRPAPSASPVCLLCSSHLWRQAVAEPMEVALASVLPCFLVYGKVGQAILGMAEHSLKSNPYRKWILTYGDASFDEQTGKLVNLCDDAASKALPVMRRRMTDAFVTGVRLERMFWNSAYEKQTWII